MPQLSLQQSNSLLSFLIVLSAVVLFFGFSTPTAYATDVSINAQITPSGEVTLDCIGTNITQYQHREGAYPDTTRIVSTGNVVSYDCENYTSSLETGYGDETGSTTPDGTYWVRLQFDSQGSTDYIFQAQRVNSEWLGIGNNGTSTVYADCPTCTRIISTTPTNGSFFATSTSKVITTTHYINPDDWDPDYEYKVTYYYYPRKTYAFVDIIGSALAPFAQTNETIITGSGTGTTAFLATKLDVIGIYDYEVKLTRSKTGFFAPFTALFSSSNYQYERESGYYTAGTTTDYENLKNAMNLGDSIVDRLAGCTPFDFTNLELNASSTFMGCVGALFVPTRQDLENVGNVLRQGMLEKVPFGYATRIYDLLLSSSTVIAVPSITISFPDILPISDGTTLVLEVPNNVNDSVTMLDTVTTPTMTGSPYSNFMYYWTMLWWLMFAFWVLGEVFGTIGFVARIEGADMKHKNRSESVYESKSGTQYNTKTNSYTTIRKSKRL